MLVAERRSLESLVLESDNESGDIPTVPEVHEKGCTGMGRQKESQPDRSGDRN